MASRRARERANARPGSKANNQSQQRDQSNLGPAFLNAQIVKPPPTQRTDMQEDTKISDLTVAEFRQLMQQCFERDRAMEPQREMARLQANLVKSPGPQRNPAQGGGNPYNNFGGRIGGSFLGD